MNSPVYDLHALKHRLDRPMLRRAVDGTQVGKPRKDWKGGIPLAVHLEEQAIGLSLLRDKTDTDVSREGVPRRGEPHLIAVGNDLPGRNFNRTEQCFHQLLLTHTLQRGHPYDLSFK